MIKNDLLSFLENNGDCLNRLQKIVATVFYAGQYHLCWKICLLHPAFKVSLLCNLHQLALPEFPKHGREIGTLLSATMESAKEANVDPIFFREKVTSLVKELVYDKTSAKKENAPGEKKENASDLKLPLELLHATQHPNQYLWQLAMKNILNSKDVDSCKFAHKCFQERVKHLLANRKRIIDVSESSKWIKLDAIRIRILWRLKNAGVEFPGEDVCTALEEMLNEKDPLNVLFPDLDFRHRRFLSCLIVWLKEASASPSSPEYVVEFERIAALRPLIYTLLSDCIIPKKLVKIETSFVALLLNSTKGKNIIQALNIFAELLTQPSFPAHATQQHGEILLQFTKSITYLPLEDREKGMMLLSTILDTYKRQMAQHPTLCIEHFINDIQTNLNLLINETATTVLDIGQIYQTEDTPAMEFHESEIFSKLLSFSQSDKEEELREAEAIMKLNGHGLNPIQLKNTQVMLTWSQLLFSYKNNQDSSREFSVLGADQLEHIIPFLPSSDLKIESIELIFHFMTTLFTHPKGLMRYSESCTQYFNRLVSDYCVLPSSTLTHNGHSMDHELLKDFVFQRKKNENTYEISPRQILNRFFNARLANIFGDHCVSKNLILSNIDSHLNDLLDSAEKDFPNCKFVLRSFDSTVLLELSHLLLECLLQLHPQEIFQKELLNCYIWTPLLKLLMGHHNKALPMIESYICSSIWNEEPTYSTHRRHSLFLLDAAKSLGIFNLDDPLLHKLELYLNTSNST